MSRKRLAWACCPERAVSLELHARDVFEAQTVSSSSSVGQRKASDVHTVPIIDKDPEGVLIHGS